jgi:hypothetical protein
MIAAAKAKLGHVRILPIASIRPSPENEKVYRPVNPDDPDIQALAESIRTFGVKEPLVVSRDMWILSGHRRHTAAKLADLAEVPCRVESISRELDPDGFVHLLREYNRQRVKTFDEATREELVSMNLDNAYQTLIMERWDKARIDPRVRLIDTGTQKCRSSISKAKLAFLDAVLNVLQDLKDFWPVSDRTVHYRLLNRPPLIHASKPDSTYRNNLTSYKSMTDLLTRARLTGAVPWEAIADPTRPVRLWKTHANVAPFIREHIDGCLAGFWRDLMQSQINHYEIVVEKNTVESLVKPVAAEYTIPLTSGRGYCSLQPRYEMAQRFRKSGKERLVLLMLTDHDPDGEEIAASFARSMRNDFNVRYVEPVKVALTAEQVERFQLPPRMSAKATSSNYAKFVEKHGDTVHELEGLTPADLQQVLRGAIESVLDREAFQREVRAEKEDAVKLVALRQQLRVVLAGMVEGRGDSD